MNKSDKTNKNTVKMCDISTLTPDGHVVAILNHMRLNVLSALTSIRSIVKKNMLDAHYLNELSDHKALENPLPDIQLIREETLNLLRDQRIQWGEEEKKLAKQSVSQQCWEIPDKVMENLVDWLLVDLLKR